MALPLTKLSSLFDSEGVSNVLVSTDEETASESLKKPLTKTAQFIGSFMEAYKGKYNRRPILDGPDHAAAKRIATALQREELETYANAYLSMAKSWYVTKRHKLQYMSNDLNEISEFIASGRLITRATAQKTELDSHNLQVMNRVMAKYDAERENQNETFEGKVIDASK